MINGAHMLVYTSDVDGARKLFRDVLKLPNVDVGQGWLIFALPPSEIAFHPAESHKGDGRHEIYLMCEDINATVAALKKSGVEITTPVSDQGWGLLTSIRVPGGGEMGLYQPRHARPK
ncbi:MAG: extradiol dioxygenase [Phycisphaerae bacterium]